MCRGRQHRSHKELNNRAENAHLPTRRKEKCLIKFKSPQGVQRTLALMGKIRNLFAIEVGQSLKKASERRDAFRAACTIWSEAAQQLLCV
jgi:putative transposase